jgi:hypothetical protein
MLSAHGDCEDPSGVTRSAPRSHKATVLKAALTRGQDPAFEPSVVDDQNVAMRLHYLCYGLSSVLFAVPPRSA